MDTYTILIALAGWFAVHRLTSQRDLENKRRELHTKCLIEAYRRLVSSAVLVESSEEHKLNVESSIDDIQLFGTRSQISLVNKILEEIESTNVGDYTDLIRDLRNSLRDELKLDPVSSDVQVIMFNAQKAQK